MADTSLTYSIFARDKTGPAMKSIGSSFEKVGGLGKKLIGGLAVVGGAAGALGFAKGLIDDARESAKVGRLTEAVIKSTGKAANISSKQVGDLATAISNKTGADDEAIQSGSNLLLTFTNVKNEAGKGNDVFNQATQTITDMTAALNGGDVSAEKIKGSSIQLGKALNDPIKGITALSKSGVSFTEGQKKQITAMVKSGDTMGAQKVILAELNKEFGGAAAAASDPAQKATVAWGNLREQLGGYLLPIFNKLVGVLSGSILPAVSKFFDNVQSGGGAFAKVREAVGRFSSFITGTVLPAVQRFGSWFMSVALPAITRFGQKLWSDLQPALRQISKSFKEDLLPAAQSLIAKFKEAWPNIQRVATILGTVAKFIMTKVVPVLISLYANYLAKVIRVFGSVFAIVWKVIGALVSAGAAVGRAGAAFGRFVSTVAGAMGRFYKAVFDTIGKAVRAVAEFPGKAIRAVGQLAGALRQHGLDFIQGFINGIIDKAASIPGIIKDKVVGVAKSALHGFGLFGSPSRLTMKYGRWWTEGFAIGMKDKAADVVAKAKELVNKLKEKLAEVKDFAREIKSAFVDAGNVTSLDTGEDTSFGGMLAKLQAQAAAAKAYATGMATLRKRGLNETTLGQLREAGPMGGAQSVQTLLGGDVGQVNAAVRDLARTGEEFGNREAKRKYGIDPSKQQKLKISINLEGGDADLKRRLQKMVRVEGGGDVQVAFGK